MVDVVPAETCRNNQYRRKLKMCPVVYTCHSSIASKDVPSSGQVYILSTIPSSKPDPRGSLNVQNTAAESVYRNSAKSFQNIACDLNQPNGLLSSTKPTREKQGCSKVHHRARAAFECSGRGSSSEFPKPIERRWHKKTTNQRGMSCTVQCHFHTNNNSQKRPSFRNTNLSSLSFSNSLSKPINLTTLQNTHLRSQKSKFSNAAKDAAYGILGPSITTDRSRLVIRPLL